MKKPQVENIDSELDKLIDIFDEQLAVSTSLRKKSLSVEGLERKIKSIERRIAKIETSQFTEVEERITTAKKIITEITEIQEKLKFHTHFSDLVESGGLIGLTEKYAAQLLSLFHRADDISKSKNSSKKSSPLSDQKQAASVVNGLTLFKQAYKVQKAYQGIYSGLKYKKAEFTSYLNKSAETIQADLSTKLRSARLKMREEIKAIKKSKKSTSKIQAAIQQIKPNSINPIKLLSKRNLQQLKQALSIELKEGIKLKKFSNNTNNSFGLLPDEIAIFGALLNLPYKLQHGTNHFADIARNGRLDSLTEIHRHRPHYESPFSTPGNLQELGNGGFVFFRCYVDGINSDQTRYGNTRMVTDLSLLREIGWVSLHDQLVPFSSHNRQQTLYEGKRLLFKATPAHVNNKAHKNKSADGISYTYRTAPITTYHTGSKDTQKSFGTTITTKSETIKFTEEIFYGQDILPGIALSILHRLRRLRECGYRQKVLADFNRASEIDKVLILGKLVKDLYRIEGKYPLGLPFEYNTTNQRAFFKPIAGSDRNRKKKDRLLIIENPEGDGRHNIDLSVNTENAKQAFFNEKLQEAESQISILQKQVARTNKPEDIANLAMYRRRKEELDTKLQQLQTETEKYILEISEACNAQEMIWIRKRSYEFLKLVASHFVGFIQDGVIPIEDFKAISLQKLSLLAHETWINLLADNEEFWTEMLTLTLSELEGMAEGNIALAIDERGYSFEQLRALFNEDEEVYSYATCEDLQELVYEHAPSIPDKLFKYVQESGEDIDWEEIADDLEGNERTMFEMNLEGYFGRTQDSDEESNYSRYSW